MKHLKLFENFSDINNIKSYLKDIFLELEDDGFTVEIEIISQATSGAVILIPPGHYFRIDIHKTDYPVSWSPKESDRFILKDIWPTLQTANTYMTEEGYKLILLSGVVPDKRGGRSDHRGYPTHYMNVSPVDIKPDNSFFDDELFSLRIEFKK